MTCSISLLDVTGSAIEMVIILTGFCTLWILYGLYRATRSPNAGFWASQPSVGWQKQWFPNAQANWRSMTEARSMIANGYLKYSKSNIPFAIPSVAAGNSVVIPHAQIKTVFSKPDSEVSAIQAQREVIQAAYTITDKDIYMNEFHLEIVHKQLTRNIPLLTAVIAEELDLAFKRYWGTSSEWVSIKLYDSILNIVARAVNRSFIGLPICRNEEFIEHSIKYSESVFGGGIMINIAPACLRSIIGPPIGLIAKRHLVVCKKICAPVVEERLRHTEKRRREPDFKWEPPDDVLQWVIEACQDTHDPKQLETDRITHRLLMFNLVAIHAISITTTETILDLYSSPPSEGFVDGIREEYDRVFAQRGGGWTKDAVSKLYRLDSTIRESLRFSNFGVVALSRRITAPDGIMLEGKIRVPAGIRLCAPMHEIHHDSAYYSDPSTFDAFRFSRPLEADGNDSKAASMPIRQSATAGGDTFLAFGFGKHMCPGRFFAVNEMKLMLATMLKNYDVDFMAERPARQSVMENMVPFKSTAIRVRQRVEE